MIIILVVVFILLMVTTFLSVKTMLYMREHNDIVFEENELRSKCCFHEKHDCDEEGVCVSSLQKRCGQLATTNCVDPLTLCETMSKEECILDKNKRLCEYNTEDQCVTVVNPYNSVEIPCAEYDKMIKFGYLSDELNCDKNLSI